MKNEKRVAMTTLPPPHPSEGILLLNKPKGSSSFSLVRKLRKWVGVQKIGHAGTLDPFATGVMVMLIGRRYTKLSNQFLEADKVYWAELRLGLSTDTYDCEGRVTRTSDFIPSIEEVRAALELFQGEVSQIPPMFSAKKQQGKKLYELARRGIEVERPAVKVRLLTECIEYSYPFLRLKVSCSKGTYIRSLAQDLGDTLGCGAHLTNLTRLKSGKYELSACLAWEELENSDIKLDLLRRHTETT